MDILAWILCILYAIRIVRGRCFFPGELQGVWATQAAPDVADAPIAYSMVTIDADQISTWGRCHSKIDQNIILADRSGPHSAQCFRCFRLVVASVNVAALVSGGLESCFASVEEALLSCPTTERGAAHIVLYKVRPSYGGSGVQETQCPFSGNFFFSYEKGAKGHRGSRNTRCEQLTSEMTNCPFGFSLSLQYRDCTFRNPRSANWHCLGSWDGLDGQKYTAVLDMDAREGDGKPKYKCGIYRPDKSGRIMLAFSRDSTCINDLVDAEDGYERFVLFTVAASPLPNVVRDHSCRFPSSLRGEWHNTRVERSSIAFKNEQNFNTLHMQCVKDMGDSERYMVYTRTDCGKWYYNCVMIKRRNTNIIEIMFGEKQSGSLSPDLCDDREFNNLSVWITQAKSRPELPTSCPIVGTYQGELPDSPGYCAQLYSDCGHKDLMYYAIDECINPQGDIYEQGKFPRPHQLKPGVFIPPERFDEKLPPSPNTPFNSTPRRLPGGVPPEIQIGSINHLMPSRRSEVPRPSYETSLKSLASLQILKKRKKRRAQRQNYNVLYNPKTTTISFLWGPSNNPTTAIPLVDRVNANPRINHYNLRNLDSFGGVFDSSSRPRVNNQQNTFDRPAIDGFDQRGGSHFPSFQRNNYDANAGNGFHHNRHINFGEDERSSGGYVQRPIEDENWNSMPPGHGNGDSSMVDARKSNSGVGQFGSEIRSEGIRSLPVSNAGSGPIGFWPSSQRNEENRELARQPTFTQNPIYDGEPSIPGKVTWGPSPSPVPAWVEITDFSEHSNIKKRNNTQSKFYREERVYQCIGEWEEDGRVYALTRRKDIHTYECFVGVNSEKGTVFMKEAGSSCRRGIRPDDFGMKTIQKSNCPIEVDKKHHQNDIAVSDEGWRESQWRSRSRAAPPTRPPWVPSTTRPWKPITGRPRRRNTCHVISSSIVLIVSSISLLKYL